MAEMAKQLDNNTRSAVDTTLRATDLLSDDRIATVMGTEAVTAAGIRDENELKINLEQDATLKQLIAGIPENDQKAIMARMGQLGSNWTKIASSEAVKKATDEFISQVAQPATSRMNEAVADMNEANSNGIGLTAKALAKAGAMSKERADAIQEYQISVNKISIQIQIICSVQAKSGTELHAYVGATNTSRITGGEYITR